MGKGESQRKWTGNGRERNGEKEKHCTDTVFSASVQMTYLLIHLNMYLELILVPADKGNAPCMVPGIYFIFPTVWLAEQIENNFQTKRHFGGDDFATSVNLNFLLTTLCEPPLLSASKLEMIIKGHFYCSVSMSKHLKICDIQYDYGNKSDYNYFITGLIYPSERIPEVLTIDL